MERTNAPRNVARKPDLPSKPYGETGDHPDHRGCDACKRACQPGDRHQLFKMRGKEKNPQKTGKERHPKRQEAGDKGQREPAGLKPCEKSHELRHQNQWPRRGFRKPQGIDHLWR